MKKLEELISKRDSELESERKRREDARKAKKKEFADNLVTFPLTGGGIGFGVSILVGFFKGCGLFHYDSMKGNAYLFDTKDAGNGFWVLPIVGASLGLLYALISSTLKKD